MIILGSPEVLGVIEVKQKWDLTFQDFEKYPVWIGVHSFDYGKPWYESCDEASFRPWSGPFPVDGQDGAVLARAIFRLNDGGSYPGLVRVVGENWDMPPSPRKTQRGAVVSYRSVSERHGGPSSIIGLQQPRMLVNHELFEFWGGRKGVLAERRRALYTALAKSSETTFPLQFSVDSAFAKGVLSGILNGFYREPKVGESLVVEF